MRSRRTQRFIEACVAGGLTIILLCTYQAVRVHFFDVLRQFSGTVTKTEYVHVPANSNGRNSEHFDLYVWLTSHSNRFVFKSFSQAETNRIESALNIGSLATLDAEAKNLLVWGVTVDGIMYLSPSLSRDQKLKDMYWMIVFGIILMITGGLTAIHPSNWKRVK